MPLISSGSSSGSPDSSGSGGINFYMCSTSCYKSMACSFGNSQLVLGVLQSSAGVVEVVGLEVTAAISPHQLIVQLLDACLKVGVLLK
jgi:hypothetical protein